MHVDVRVPIGILFCLIGGVLAAYGLVVNDARARPTGVPIDLVWGAIMLLFGALMLALAARAARRARALGHHGSGPTQSSG